MTDIVLIAATTDCADARIQTGDLVEVDIEAEPKRGDVVAFDLGSRVGCGLRLVVNPGERRELDIGVVVAVRKQRAAAA